MDKNIDLKDLINSLSNIGDNTEFLKELISLNGSNEFSLNDDISQSIGNISENQMQCLNITTGSEQQINGSNFSLQLLTDHEMDTQLTPSLDSKANISKTTKLFAFHNKRQLFENNFCVDKQTEESKENIEIKDNSQWDNTLGLSPVKKELIADNFSFAVNNSLSTDPNLKKNAAKDLDDFNGVQFNSFSSDVKQMESESYFGDNNSFKSLSKCSDLDLRPEIPKLEINETFRSPNSEFGNKSIASYFKQHSEPISFKSTNDSIAFKTINDFSNDLNQSFAPVFDEIDSSNNTLDSVQKLIQRKNRKRKSISTLSMSDSQENQSQMSFTPSVNSTLNSIEDITDKESPNSVNGKSVVTSGLGTMTTLGQTYSMPNSHSVSLSNGNTLNLNQLLIVSPNVLSLTMGCFVDFKLNYLKVKNLSITSFRAEIKLQTNADTLNSLQIDFPKQSISIPAFFDGLLTEQITITPLKSGSFSICFQIYISIEGINLPIAPTAVICHIKAKPIVIKRPLFFSDCLEFNYNLFEDNTETQTIDLCVSNRQIINEIPLKMCLEANKCIFFDPIHRHPESAIHTFRCPDPNTLFLVTKTHYEMRIPIRIQSYSVHKTESCLTVSTDSQKSHVLAIFRLSATFWAKRESTKELLQCSDTSISLETNKWKEIYFRNKSKHNLLRICLKSNENWVKLSTSQLMIPPLHKASIGLVSEQKSQINGNSSTQLLVTYDSGFGKSFRLSIPIQSLSAE